jgi:hypothetical protein
MRFAQLDQNLSSRKLIKACGESGQITALPPSGVFKGKDDETIFRELIPLGNLLVTNDRKIVQENVDVIPSFHPGILIVMQDPGAVRTMTWKLTLSILHGFKTDFPAWNEVPWQNSILNPMRNRYSIFTSSFVRAL